MIASPNILICWWLILRCGMNLRVDELSCSGKETMVRRFDHEGLRWLQKHSHSHSVRPDQCKLRWYNELHSSHATQRTIWDQALCSVFRAYILDIARPCVIQNLGPVRWHYPTYFQWNGDGSMKSSTLCKNFKALAVISFVQVSSLWSISGHH